MKIKSITFIIIFFVSLFSSVRSETPDILEFKGETIIIPTTDGLKIKADIYETDHQDAPVILLFHQAGFSRGEYRETAPLLNKLGFNCIAIDQRSGKSVNGVKNDIFVAATVKGLSTKYPDAFPDLEAALKYAINRYPFNQVIVWGSSYSASLVFVLAQKYTDKIAAVVAFSPGEYFKFEGKKIGEYAKDIKCPVFITSAKNEYGSWKGIYENIPEGKITFFLPEKDGLHGSKALWKSNDNNKDYWTALNKFLAGLSVKNL